ncbi:hypothetical protein [Flavobacterium psychrotrophum]|uniref:hypothetical protein n=1 Tax=Flavobacterium psychrotrophum TaxID=2294119 RepID=UPI0013C4BCC5|nr:hypothetical protein [Flavobacterium psychrotrophum]
MLHPAKLSLFVFVLSVPFYKTFAQAKDSIPKEAIKFVADKFPFTRMINTEFRYDAPYDFSARIPGVSQPEGRVTRLYQQRVNANINFIKSPKWVFSTGLFYNYIHAETQGANLQQTESNEHYYAATVTLTRFTKLFGKMALFTATALPSGGENGFERITGMVSGTLVLKANAKTKMTIGLLGLIDPSSQVPAFVTLSYEHKFDNGWIADIILPKRLFMKKDVFSNGRLSLGTELDNTTVYLKGFNRNTSKTYIFSQLETMSGATYEHCIFKGFIATLKTGYKYTPTSRIVAVNKKFTDYVFKATPNGNFYVNLGLSYNP